MFHSRRFNDHIVQDVVSSSWLQYANVYQKILQTCTLHMYKLLVLYNNCSRHSSISTCGLWRTGDSFAQTSSEDTKARRVNVLAVDQK